MNKNLSLKKLIVHTGVKGFEISLVGQQIRVHYIWAIESSFIRCYNNVNN